MCHRVKGCDPISAFFLLSKLAGMKRRDGTVEMGTEGFGCPTVFVLALMFRVIAFVWSMNTVMSLCHRKTCKHIQWFTKNPCVFAKTLVLVSDYLNYIPFQETRTGGFVQCAVELLCKGCEQ